MDNDDAGRKAAESIKKKCQKTYNLYNIEILKEDIGSMTIQDIQKDIIPKIEKL